MEKEHKIFLGGTCNGSLWRNEIIPELKIPYFNPVVLEWSEEVQKLEDQAKDSSRYNLYVITPKMLGFYSIAEIINDSFDRTKVTIFTFKSEDDGQRFNSHQIKSLNAVGKLMESNGGIWVREYKHLAKALNFICH